MDLIKALKQEERGKSEQAAKLAATGNREGAKRAQAQADLARWQRKELGG